MQSGLIEAEVTLYVSVLRYLLASILLDVNSTFLPGAEC